MTTPAAQARGSGPPTTPVWIRKGWTLGCLAAFAMLTACDGPNETAGKEQDKATAAALGRNYTGSGPQERIGEAKDRAVAARQDAKDAAANALKAQGDDIKRQADVDAASLDEQSRAIREAASKQAATLDEQASAARK